MRASETSETSLREIKQQLERQNHTNNRILVSGIRGW